MKQEAVKTIIRDFHTKIVGVTYGNADGSSRQEYIKNLKPNQELIFRPVPTAEYPDAVGVFTLDGKQLGHVSAEIAAELKNKYPENYMQASVAKVTGGNGLNYGCNIHIIIYGDTATQSGPRPVNQPVQSVQPKRKTWLWVLGWIFIFPLPLTLIIAKKPDLSKAIKCAIIVATWVVYVILCFVGGLANGDETKSAEQDPFAQNEAVVQSVSD